MSFPTATLLPGDCLDIMPTLEAGSVDMVLSDPPYGSTECPWDAVIPFGPLWTRYARLVRWDGAIVLNSSQPFTTALIASNLPCFAYVWNWNKGVSGSFALARKMPLRTQEDVCVFANSGRLPRYFPQMEQRQKPATKGGTAVISASSPMRGEKWRSGNIKGKVYTERFPTMSLTFSSRAAGQRGFHPTQKPVALLEYLIRTYTNEGETVLDNTMGSGSTGVACMNTGRNFIGIERDPTYFSIAEKRIAEARREPTQPLLFAAE